MSPAAPQNRLRVTSPPQTRLRRPPPRPSPPATPSPPAPAPSFAAAPDSRPKGLLRRRQAAWTLPQSTEPRSTRDRHLLAGYTSHPLPRDFRARARPRPFVASRRSDTRCRPTSDWDRGGAGLRQDAGSRGRARLGPVSSRRECGIRETWQRQGPEGGGIILESRGGPRRLQIRPSAFPDAGGKSEVATSR